jgi:hypothetical protein
MDGDGALREIRIARIVRSLPSARASINLSRSERRKGGLLRRKKRLQSEPRDLVDRKDLFRGATLGKSASVTPYLSMSSKSLEGKVGVVFGVANKRSIAWAIAQAWAAAGAKLIFNYQGERLKENVEDLISTFGSDVPLFPCDVTSDSENSLSRSVTIPTGWI